MRHWIRIEIRKIPLAYKGNIVTKHERVLILAPHTDDGELACGGTICRLIEEGKDCYYVKFYSCDDSLPPGFEKGALIEELKNGITVLGIPDENRIIFDFRVRYFPQLRQEILEEMVRLNKELQPELVLLPTQFDTHQDHSVIAQEGFRAFKKCSMFGYEVPWNNLTFVSSGFVELKNRHIEKKIEAVACYKTQANRAYTTSEYIKSLAITRGVQIGVAFAETYEVIRSVNRI